ncbi:MAG: peroxidase [Gemmatimonadetes bacterium]|nr:peroxidase [Gemmatimonadota bacterium]MYE91881.1 peroxidase [Gemmatimonadota bacterium]MYJ11694.1 peroxidase [Gemmatimonadota bacterium]
MLDYAVKLTRDPGRMDAGDVDRLRDAGFDDPAILDICQVVSYYNYVNRLADGLGVELEDDWDDTSLAPASGPAPRYDQERREHP